MRAIADRLARVSAALDRLALFGAILAVCVMIFAALYQVVARYIFFSPPAWTEELARYAMIWGGLLGASVAFRAGSDPTLFPGMARMQGRVGIALSLLRASGVLLFALPVLWFCIFGPRLNPARGFIMRSAERQADILDVSMLWVTAAVPVLFLLIVIHLLAEIAARLTFEPVAATVSKDT